MTSFFLPFCTPCQTFAQMENISTAATEQLPACGRHERKVKGGRDGCGRARAAAAGRYPSRGRRFTPILASQYRVPQPSNKVLRRGMTTMPTYKPIQCSVLSQTTSQFRTLLLIPWDRAPCKMHTKHTMRTFLALASLPPSRDVRSPMGRDRRRRGAEDKGADADCRVERRGAFRVGKKAE